MWSFLKWIHKQRHHVSHVNQKRKEGKQGFVHRDWIVGRNKLSLKTTGECFKCSACTDTAAMQMVSEETVGGQTEDTCFGKTDTVLREYRRIQWRKSNKTVILSVSHNILSLSLFLFSPNGASLPSLRPSHYTRHRNHSHPWQGFFYNLLNVELELNVQTATRP